MRLCTLVITIAIAANAFAQTNAPIDNFSVVTNLWYNGYKSNVLAIAEQRLAANSNDLAGLVLKFNYDLGFLIRSNYSNDIVRVTNALQRADLHSHSNATVRLRSLLFRQSAIGFLDYLANPESALSPEEETVDRQKGLINHKPLSDELFLKMLSEIGLF